MKAKARKKAIKDDLTYMAPELILAMTLWNAYYECADMNKSNDLNIIIALWKAEAKRERVKWIRVASAALVVQDEALRVLRKRRRNKGGIAS